MVERVQVRLETGKRRVVRLELEPEVERSLDVRQDADDGSPVRVVRPRGVAAQNAHGVAKVGARPEHGVHEGTDGLEVAGAEGGGGLVVLRSRDVEVINGGPVICIFTGKTSSFGITVTGNAVLAVFCR